MQAKVSRLAALPLLLVGILTYARSADSLVSEHVIPETPDGTVLAIAKGLQANHPEILWAALPESYRQDITEITHTFAEKMDPAIYDRAFALLMRAVEVLDDRKDVIFASETFQSTGADADEIRAGLSNVQVFTGTLKASEIATLAGLGSVDWEKFLATTGAQFIQRAATIDTAGGHNPLDDLDTLQVEVLDRTGGRATLRISSEGHEPQEVEMARVEGRWIPAEMADKWSKSIDDARQDLAEMTPENMAAQKTQIMMFFGMADGFIEQIASLQTPEEFDAAIGPMLAPFMGGAATGMSEEEEAEGPASPRPQAAKNRHRPASASEGSPATAR